jgi:hypothetical protein
LPLDCQRHRPGAVHCQSAASNRAPQPRGRATAAGERQRELPRRGHPCQTPIPQPSAASATRRNAAPGREKAVRTGNARRATAGAIAEGLGHSLSMKEWKHDDPGICLALAVASVAFSAGYVRHPGVFAHPDDETTVSPLLARYAAAGHPIRLVTVTSGPKRPVHPPLR